MSPEPLTWRVVRRGTVSSTMDEAFELVDSGAPEGTVVVADHQTAGRGRGGRTWTDRPGDGLLLSAILRPVIGQGRLGTLPLIAGVAVAEALEDVAGIRCRLKWPNDVWVNEDKIAGILINATPRGVDEPVIVIVGIGINLNTPPDALGPNATSVLVSSGHRADRELVLRSLIGRLDTGYRQFQRSHGLADLGGWRRRAALIGERVQIDQGGETLTGVYRGIDDDGALLLDVPGSGVRRVVSGDLVRGPARVS